jgi:enoyl-CoA hydratase
VSDPVRYSQSGSLATIVMDDGKVNAMSPHLLRGLHAAFDRAERDAAVVLLTGRQNIFSAGFDTKILASREAARIFEMVRLGAELAARVLSFPRPVVIACNGHAYPMGAFLMLAADIRIGTEGAFSIGMNEVAIGIAVPSFALELGRHRMVGAYLERTALTGDMFTPQQAMAAGFLDQVVPGPMLADTAASVARALGKLDRAAYVLTKERRRRAATAAVRAAIDAEITLEAYQRLLAPAN